MYGTNVVPLSPNRWRISNCSLHSNYIWTRCQEQTDASLWPSVGSTDDRVVVRPWQIVSSFRISLAMVGIWNAALKSGSFSKLMRRRYITPIWWWMHGIDKPPSLILAYKYAVDVVARKSSVILTNFLIRRSMLIKFAHFYIWWLITVH